MIFEASFHLFYLFFKIFDVDGMHVVDTSWHLHCTTSYDWIQQSKILFDINNSLGVRVYFLSAPRNILPKNMGGPPIQYLAGPSLQKFPTHATLHEGAQEALEAQEAPEEKYITWRQSLPQSTR